MQSNIEIKARVHDFAQTCRIAAALAGGPPRTLNQVDTFFPCANGRFKLRELGSRAGELVFYQRPDMVGAKQSFYTIYRTATPAALRETLVHALGAAIVVRKRRLLYLAGQTRIHLDTVDGLGTFLELEVVLKPGQPAAQGRAIARDLMRKLKITKRDLIPCAYADLLLESAAPRARRPRGTVRT